MGKKRGNANGVKIAGEDLEFFLRCLQHRYLKLENVQRCFPQNCTDISNDKRSALYYRIYRLVKAGYIKKQVLQGRKVYLLDRKGLDEIREMNRENLPLVQPHELKNIDHDLLVAYARFYFESHGAMDWVSEREFLQHLKEIPLVPDGAFTISDRVIFVEVELTRKSIERYEAIAKIYTEPRGPDRVVYLYRQKSVVEPLIEMTSHHERPGFFPFDEDMPPPDQVIGRCNGNEIRLDRFLGIAE